MRLSQLHQPSPAAAQSGGVTFVTVLATIMLKSWIFPPDLASDQEITAAINDFVMDGISANSRK
jgi:hypothetical protein